MSWEWVPKKEKKSLQIQAVGAFLVLIALYMLILSSTGGDISILINAFVLLIISLGILSLQNWARILLVFYCLIMLLIYLLVILVDEGEFPLPLPFVVIYFLLIVFATRLNIKEQFNRKNNKESR